MKIAYIVSSLANAGPINVVRDLVNVMVSHGHQCTVYYFSELGVNDFSCPVVRIRMTSRFPWNEYDIIHTHGGRPEMFVFLRKPFHTKCKTFTTLHNFVFEDHFYEYGRYKSQITARIILWMTYRHDRVIVLNKLAIDYYKNYLPSDKLDYAYNTRFADKATIDDEDREPIDNLKSSCDFVIGTCAALIPRKALDQIIKAISNMPNIGFIVVGDGYCRSTLENYAKRTGCDKRVLFLGQKEHAQRYLPEMDLFVIPSRSEGFPLALLEAASLGIASLSSDIPVFKELFTTAEVARFKLDDIKSLSDEIKIALINRDTLGEKILDRYLRDYSPECFYNRHIEIYNKSLSFDS